MAFKMDDPNVFAILTPISGKWGTNALKAFGQPHNSAWYVTATRWVAEEPLPSSREPTPAPASPSENEYKPTDCIVLRFDKPCNNSSNGIQFGSSKTISSVLLQFPGMKGINARQFSIVIREDRSVYLEDFFSKYGTAVSYNGQGKYQWRRKEQWILAHPPGTPKRWKTLLVWAGNLAFQVDFPNQEAGCPEYVTNLGAFVEKSRTALPSVDVLDLQSNLTTAAPSESETPDPDQPPIYIDCGEIGRGAYGVVTKVMSNRDGKFYAAKKFNRPSDVGKDKMKRKRDEAAWYTEIWKEVNIMRNNPHPNIMPVIEFIETSEPILIMPYYKLGNLQTYDPVDKSETYVRAFLQILLILRWLHSREVMHRDIKPENFLIDAETPFNIIMADFGLSNIATRGVWKTFCGTLQYCAPEVFPDNSRGYEAKADIWSLGVMMLQLMYRLPSTPELPAYNSLRKWRKIWSKRLYDELDRWSDNYDLVIDILFHMLEDDPQKRFTAEQCLQRGLENGLFRRNRDSYIILATDSEVDKPAEAVWHADSLADGTKCLTAQSLQLAGTLWANHSFASTVVSARLWENNAQECDLAAGKNTLHNTPLSTESSKTVDPRSIARKPPSHEAGLGQLA